MTEQGVDRGTSATHHRVVDRVVVDQRGQVDELSNRREGGRALLGGPIHIAGEEQERRANHLALCEQQMRVDVRDEWIVGGDNAPHFLYDAP
jgi:hypothetical protein